LLLLPLMIWARYRLGVHTLAELLGGAIVGFLLTIVELSLFTNIW
jgi:membrane-associated phospholipid phosphatase